MNASGEAQLFRSLSSPIASDIQQRGLRVRDRMKSNASGRPGPNIVTTNLVSSITPPRMGVDGLGIFCRVGPQGSGMVKRGYNYALILEGIFPRGHAPPDGHYPFMAKSLDAARN